MNTRAAVRTASWICVTLAAFAIGEILFAPVASAQGSRKDDIVFGPSGHPVAGATITVCQPTATGTPCTPLATIYTDVTLTVPATNPFKGDGIGNYHFYAPAGRYIVQITSPNITGTITYSDVILPPDLSSTVAGNNISAFGLNLGGNLSVTGNATITGTLTTTNFNPGAFSPISLNGVQKAERFPGSDVGAQINACLMAASTTSGVCDARGLTGTYTSTQHVTIPKGTTLQWCQGKLTINDSTTKDAIELGGDGASLYGCQESGLGTVPRPQTSGYIACGVAGCTTVDNPHVHDREY